MRWWFSLMIAVAACSSRASHSSDTSGAGGMSGSTGSGGSANAGEGATAGKGSGGGSSGGSSSGGSSSGGKANGGGAGGGGNDAGSAGAPSGECSDERTCVAAPPPTWQGPLLVWQGESGGEPACPAGTSAAIMGGTNVDEGEASCTCSCAGNVNCPNSINIQMFETANCNSLYCSQASPILNTELCAPIPSGICTMSQAYKVQPYAASHGCSPSVTEEIEAPRFTESVLACAPDGSQTCDNGACMPEAGAPFEATLCIAAAGDLDCPAGYPDKRVIYNSLDDERSCANDCTCAPHCLLHQPDCQADALIPIPPSGGACISIYTPGADGIGNIVPDEGCDVVNEPTLEGSVVLDDETTICCE